MVRNYPVMGHTGFKVTPMMNMDIFILQTETRFKLTQLMMMDAYLGFFFVKTKSKETETKSK